MDEIVSLTMVVIAVLAAVATLKGGGFSTRTLKEMNEATFNQTQASDQWSYFEAKSIKQNLYEIELEHLNAAVPAADAAAVAKLKARVDRYDKDKADITALAKKYEAARDAAHKNATVAAEHSKQMGLSITFFQVAIALGAMCLIIKKKPLWIAYDFRCPGGRADDLHFVHPAAVTDRWWIAVPYVGKLHCFCWPACSPAIF